MKSLLLRALLVLICVAGSVQVSAKNEKGLVGAIKVETPKRPKGRKMFCCSSLLNSILSG